MTVEMVPAHLVAPEEVAVHPQERQAMAMMERKVREGAHPRAAAVAATEETAPSSAPALPAPYPEEVAVVPSADAASR